MNREKYDRIATTFTYVELCHIEDALEAFKPNYPIDEAMVEELKENVTAARGWVHHLGKTERKRTVHRNRQGMTIAEFSKLFPGYRLYLLFSHLNEDGSTEYDPEYSYFGSADDFETKMSGYDWLFDFEITDTEVKTVKVDKRARVCTIEIEKM